MSAQVALLGATAAMGAFSAFSAGGAQASAMEAKAGEARVQGAGYEVQAAQSKVAAEQEELHRRAGLLRLLQSNRATLSGRGVSGEQGSSFDVIQDYNKDQADEDINSIRFMGESRQKMLSFAKQQTDMNAASYLNMAGMARTAGWMGAARAIGGAALSYFGLPSGGGGGAGGGGPTGMGATGGGIFGP